MDSRELSARFDVAANKLLGEDSEQVTESDVANVFNWLREMIARRYRSVDAEDVAQETLSRILANNQKPRPAIANPAGYITRMAQHVALDVLRRQSTLTANSELVEHASSAADVHAASDDELAALLDRSATHATIAEAVRIALYEGDYLAVRIVTIWLDLADELGREPTSREVATKANASHTTVIKSLSRFRAVLIRVGQPHGR